VPVAGAALLPTRVGAHTRAHPRAPTRARPCASARSQGYDIELEFTPAALQRVAELAHAERTGARGLLTVLERTLRDFKFELPSTAVTRLLVDDATVDRPAEALARLLLRDAEPEAAEAATDVASAAASEAAAQARKRA
jgi:ATP-dependent Clp protease ATP-binding subunit ClpA